jgi:hypothetical protein
MSATRLTQGGRINRDKQIQFSWDGTRMNGYEGDSLASALLANNEVVLGRSFKYHRSRGIMSAGVEESGAMITIGEGNRRDPNVKATMQELYDGLVATGQNAWPSVRHDVGAVNSLFGRFLAAGFYYKTFMGLPPMEWGKGTNLLSIRPGARYYHSLRLLERVKDRDAAQFTKSGIMVGLGESKEEVMQVMDDMRSAGIDFLTIGQYLQPTRKHAAVDRFVHPDEFKAYETIARAKGFLMVSATPLTRSSHHAGDDFAKLRAAREQMMARG